MRLFLAIDLPKEAKSELDDQVKKLQKEYAAFRWVPKSNFHITLQFFGNEFDEERIIKNVEEIVYDIPSLNLYSTDVSVFINTKIVLYLNFKRNKLLERIVDELKDRLQIKSSKKFIPHLSLARYKIPSKQQYLVLRKRLANLEIDVNFTVSKIYLFESIVENGKPHYKKKAKFLLASD